MPESLSVAGRFNGPLASGNGGYSAGLLAGFLEGAVAVTLRSPVPLDTSLDVVRGDGGPPLRVLDGETLVMEASSAAEVGAEAPAPVTLNEARAAAGRYRGMADGQFSRCFVCGRAREDALGVFAGEVEGREVVASPWTPPDWSAGPDGDVRPEIVWAVLDCPTYFAAYMREELVPSVLGRMTGRVDGRVRAGEEHVVLGWPIGAEGRKRHAGSAVLSASGDVLALARALMIELRAG